MESIIFECKVCSISVTGITDYNKHVNSLEHASAVQLNKLGNITDEDKIQSVPILNSTSDKLVGYTTGIGFQCEICQKQFSGPVPYQQHLSSAGHQKNIAMQSGSSQSCNSNVMKCEACNKTFTGSVPFNQHIASNLHKKKVLQKGLLKNTSTDVSPVIDHEDNDVNNSNCASAMRSASHQISTLQMLRCDICDKNFSGPRPYEDHQKSNGHKKKVLQKELLMEKEENKLFFISGSSLKDNNHTLHSNFQDIETYQQSEVPECRKDIQHNPVSNNLVELEKECIKKEGAGSICPVDNIIDSTITQDLESHISVIGGSTFNCKVCDKLFNGTIPLNAHLISNVHKKKVYEKEVIQKMNNSDVKYFPDSSTKTHEIVALSDHSPQLNPILSSKNNDSLMSASEWYCEVCKKQCTGPVPYSQHIKSETHCKNIRLNEVRTSYNISSSRMPVSCLTTADINVRKNEISTLGDDCIDSSVKDSDIPEVKVEPKEIVSDLIFDDVLKDLDFILPEKLNITIFGPKETIQFNSVSKS